MSVEQSVIYAMYSGMALLMDIHRPDPPARPNGLGVVHVRGSGFTSPASPDTPPMMRSAPHLEAEVEPLAAEGFTVCSICCRDTNAFPHPAQLRDLQRAVRFMRHNAAQIGIDPDHIGALGSSSGGLLVALLGLTDASGDPRRESPIDRLSAAVQCVVLRGAVLDLSPEGFNPTPRLVSAVALFLRQRSLLDPQADTDERRALLDASPINHVSAGSCPFLVIHSAADQLAYPATAERFVAALTAAGVPAELVMVPGGSHKPSFGVERDRELAGRSADWLRRFLIAPLR